MKTRHKVEIMRENTRRGAAAHGIFAVLMFIGLQAFASSNDTLVADYMPLRNGQPWPRFPVVTYVEKASNVWVHPGSPDRFPSVTEVGAPDSDFTTVVIRQPDGTSYKTYNQQGMGPYLAAVYSGDFNNDGIPDFVAIKPGTGCGLAGEYGTAVFAFSEGNHYRFTRVTSMGLGPHDIVLDPATKTFRFIHTTFCQGQASDGSVHSFWVHRFYVWQEVQFESDSKLPPIWIQYLEHPNHVATKLLTPKLKVKIWGSPAEFGERIEW
jgi:hypothetical protein